MQVDYVLILAAGKGTRMGEIGKKVPKVLWPIYKKTILELEALYAQKYCKNKIFINVHHYSEKISSFIKESEHLANVEILHEKEVLDIGGAIHNLAQVVGYKGKLMVLNSDQFIMLTEQRWKNFYQLSNQKDVVILTYDVFGKDLYNATIVENNKLVEIRKNSLLERDKKHETYTGMSIINLESLKEQKGCLKFFDSVADYKNLDVGATNIHESKYWDFGTIRRYYNSLFDILYKWHDKEDTFINFLKENNVLDGSLVKNLAYNSESERVIDLGRNINHIPRTIYLDKASCKVPDQPCIVFDDLVELIDYPEY